MNLFDLVAGLVLIASALIGFSRGAVLEVVTLFAFTVAAALAVFLLPYSAPLARQTVHPQWAANAVAVGLSFLIVYIALRLAGARVSSLARGHATLGPLDRTAGLAFGVVRALVVLGVVYLVFKATPISQPPAVLTEAKLYPLARGSGMTLASLAPGGMQRLEDFGTSLKARMGGGDPGPPPGPVEADETSTDTPSGMPTASPPADEASQPSLRVESGGPPVRRHHHHPSPAPVE